MLNIKKKIINTLIISPIKYLGFKIVSICVVFQKIFSYFSNNISSSDQYKRSLIHPLHAKVPLFKNELDRTKTKHGIDILFIYKSKPAFVSMYNNGNIQIKYYEVDSKFDMDRDRKSVV